MNQMPPARKPPLERLMARVEITAGGCWLWTGTLYNNGYVCFFDGDRNVLGHRWSYEHHTASSIPAGVEVDHKCNARACLNPAHMELVTHAENKRREVLRRTHCLNGHAFTPENTYVYRGYKRCRECHRLNALKHYKRATVTRERDRSPAPSLS